VGGTKDRPGLAEFAEPSEPNELAVARDRPIESGGDLDWVELDQRRSDTEVWVDKATASPERPACFSFVRRGQTLGGFVVLSADGPRAWVNRCPHVPYPLDFGDGDVLHEGAIVCVNHGARFDPTSGRCIWGPARGRGLEPLEIVDEGDRWRVIVGEAPADPAPIEPTTPVLDEGF
jgi:nitrite reductase/ring-hydroxylating ferredoxin subunit